MEDESLESLGLDAAGCEALRDAAVPYWLVADWMYDFAADSADQIIAFYAQAGDKALEWRKQLFSPEECEAWCSLDLQGSAVFSKVTAEQAAEFEDHGLTPAQVKLWADNSPLLLPAEICAECHQIRSLQPGLTPELALAWRHACYPYDLESWLDSGFSPLEVAEFTELEVEPYAARRWREDFPEDSARTILAFLGSHNMDIDQGLAWRAAGADADTAGYWYGYFPHQDGIRWYKAGFEAQTAKMLDDLFAVHASGFGDDREALEARVFAAQGWAALFEDISVEQIDLMEAFFKLGIRDAEQAEPWVAAGVDAEALESYLSSDCPPVIAGEWSALGYNAPAAKGLIDFHSIEDWVGVEEFTARTGQIPSRGFSAR